MTLTPQQLVRINGSGDLAMEAHIRNHIGEVVAIVRLRKDGLYEVKTSDGLRAIPKKNLDILDKQ